MSKNYHDQFLYDLPPTDQDTLKGHLTQLNEDLHKQTEGCGHEARQFLITINLAGIAGSLTYIAALKSAREIAFIWAGLSFFCIGVLAIGVVLAINTLSFRAHYRRISSAHEDMLRGRDGGITVSHFWCRHQESFRQQLWWSTKADISAYASFAFSILGLSSIALKWTPLSRQISV